MPSYTDYWAMSTNYNKISDKVSLKRFQQIRRYLHFSYNNSVENSLDRLIKVRPVLDTVVNNCNKIPQGKEQATDVILLTRKLMTIHIE